MLEDKVTSLELSKLLYEKGITKGYESCYYWQSIRKGEDYQLHTKGMVEQNQNHFYGMGYPALLLSELMELMPSEIDGYNLEMEKCMIDAPYNDRPYYGCHYHSLQKGRPPYLDIGRAGILDTPLLALEALAKHLITQDLWKT
jgi:hypothetical protein